MQNKRLFVKILVGFIFSVAGNYVFAGDAFDQLSGGIPNFDGAGSYKGVVAMPGVSGPAVVTSGDIAANKAAELALDTKAAAAPAAVSPAVPALAAVTADTPPAPPEPAPNPIKEFLSEAKAPILLAGVGAYLGFAIAATVAGALTGGLLLVAFFLLSRL
ncbi:MAG: hypothetical protein KKH28_09465 [Elusimicrobia bacterium]|nr:hypothetical protein [Elusimicrobiota bacterium]